MAIRQPEQASDSESARLDARRQFLQLPLAERRRKLAEQADNCVGYYEQELERSQREDWQAGDVVEY